jgi:hypothetical protein
VPDDKFRAKIPPPPEARILEAEELKTTTFPLGDIKLEEEFPFANPPVEFELTSWLVPGTVAEAKLLRFIPATTAITETVKIPILLIIVFILGPP